MCFEGYKRCCCCRLKTGLKWILAFDILALIGAIIQVIGTMYSYYEGSALISIITIYVSEGYSFEDGFLDAWNNGNAIFCIVPLLLLDIIYLPRI